MSSGNVGKQDSIPWSNKWADDVVNLEWDLFAVRVTEQTDPSWLRKLSCRVVNEFNNSDEIRRRIRTINKRIDDLEE